MLEFYDMCDVLQSDFQKIGTTTWVQRCAPGVYGSGWFRALRARVAGAGRERHNATIIGLMVLNSFAVFIESLDDLNDTETAASETAWGWVEFTFSMLYFADLVAKLATLPWDEYWTDGQNRFDFGITWLLFGVSVYWASPLVGITASMLHYFTLLRVMRLIVLLGQ